MNEPQGPSRKVGQPAIDSGEDADDFDLDAPPEGLTLDPKHPVERLFIECVETMRARSQKYTASRWDDNFAYVSRRLSERRIRLAPSEVALVLLLVKEARQVAAEKSNRRDFDDDSMRDSDLDDINYRVLMRALKDQEEARDV